MKVKSYLLVVSLVLALVILDSCKSAKGGKTKGRQQPKTGKMPCPQKDC